MVLHPFAMHPKTTLEAFRNLSIDRLRIFTMCTTRNMASGNVNFQLILIESEGFSEYMINYMYGEKSKYVEKECDDWSVL